MNAVGFPRSMTGKTGLIIGSTGIRRAAPIGLSSMGARVGIRRLDHHAAVEFRADLVRLPVHAQAIEDRPSGSSVRLRRP